jgi:hypothetical protein
MYIRLKIFDRKAKGDKIEKPFFFYEGIGNNAIQLMVIEVIHHFFGQSKSDKIQKKIDDIKEILTEES